MVKKNEKDKRVIPQRVPGQRPVSTASERPSQTLFAEVLKQIQSEEADDRRSASIIESESQPVPVPVPEVVPVPDPEVIPVPVPTHTSTSTRSHTSTSTGTNRPKKAGSNIAGNTPVSDYNKRANSIDRDALPAGLFPAGSKAVYDALYLRTVGAIKPGRTIQATRAELMKWTGIKNIKTIITNVKHLTASGLINVTKFPGQHEGSLYEIFLPEEIEFPAYLSTRPVPTVVPKVVPVPVPVPDPDQYQTLGPDQYQKLDPDQYQELVWVGSGNPTENKGGYESPNTSLKHLKTYDDEQFAPMLEILKAGCIEVCGKQTSKNHAKNWADLAQVLILELKVAADRTGSVSNPPAFLAEVLRRRFLYSRKIEDGSKKTTKPDLVGKADPLVKNREVGEPLEGQEGREKALEDILGFVSFAGGKIKPGDLEEFETWYAPEDWEYLRAKLNEYEIW